MDLRPDEIKILELTNAERVKAGKTELVFNPQLKRASDLQASNMAALGVMDHELFIAGQRTLKDRVNLTKYQWSSIAENIARNQKSPKDVVDDWMNSPGHRANIMGNFSEIGIAIRYGPNGEPYYCQVFGQPR